MLRDLNFRDALRRELDEIVLPPEREWVPSETRGSGSRTVITLVAIALALAAAAIAPALGSRFQPAQEPAIPEMRVTPPARPTVVNGVALVPFLSILYRNVQFNYNLTVPAWFRNVPVAPTAPEAARGLLDRQVFTAHPAVDTRFAQNAVVPWDVVIEVWQRRDLSAEEWATTFGCGDASSQVVPCNVTRAELPRWVHRITAIPAVLATPTAPVRGKTYDKTYVLERGDELIVFRYAVGDERDRPADVTASVLEEIIGSIGLPPAR